MRALLAALVLLLPATSLAQNIEPPAGSARWLYNQCKQVEQNDEGETLSTLDRVAAIQCMAYMAGAFQGYNWATAKTCDLTKRTSRELTKTFLQVYRATPDASRDQEAQVVTGIVLDVCFCNKDPDLKAVICPLFPPN